MSITSKITGLGRNVLNKFGSSPMEITAKGLGLLTLGTTLYDAHVNGSEKAVSTDRIDTADRYERNYKNYITMDSKSRTISNFKKCWFDYQRSFTLPHLWSKTCGYVKGFSKTMLFDLPLIGISAAAITARKFPKIGKTAGILLMLNAVKTFICDIVGIGGSNRN